MDKEKKKCNPGLKAASIFHEEIIVMEPAGRIITTQPVSIRSLCLLMWSYYSHYLDNCTYTLSLGTVHILGGVN